MSEKSQADSARIMVVVIVGGLVFGAVYCALLFLGVRL